MQKSIPQLKTRITQFVGVVITAVILVSALSLYIQYKNALAFAERQASDYAKALAEHSESAFAEADRTIRDTIHDLKIGGGIERFDRRALFDLLQREAEGSPQVGSLFIADKNGEMIANSNMFPQPQVSIADRDYFRHYQNTLGADLIVSNTIMGRLVARWRFNLVRPMTGADNTFKGVVAVAIEADYFNRFMNPASFGKRGRVLLIRDDGSPLVSEPYETNAYKANFNTSNLFRTKLPAAPTGTYHDVLGAGDNGSRIISYQHLNRFPVVAVVALHKWDVIAPWAWKSLFQSVITIGLCLVIALMTRSLFRHMDSLKDARSAVSNLEEELRHLQRVEDLGEMAGKISHDFNNLLTPILVYSEMIKRGLPEDHRQQRRLEGIISAANKARDLNGKLMSFGRRQTLCMELLDPNDVIESFRATAVNTLRENIAIDMRLETGTARVMADRSQLEKVFQNLTANAQDAIEGSGTISVTTGHVLLDKETVRQRHGMMPGPYVLIAFNDNGCGMSAETLSHIYEPFFSARGAGHGDGLGLAAVYGIIKQHGGYIEIRSHVGEGTSVLIYLPEATEVTDRITGQTAAAGSTPHSASAVILLVEDDLMVREMAADLLKSEGYSVLVADSPSKAEEIEQSYSGTIDLLLTDVVMPEMNGVELYKILQYKRPAMPVLYISGYTSDADVSNGTLGENVNFIKKPFTVDLFIDKVRQIVESR